MCGAGKENEFQLVRIFYGGYPSIDMSGDRSFGNTSPWTWVGSVPIYASTVLAAVHAVAMVATALAMAAGAEWLLQALSFSSAGVRGGAVWQFVTYAFVHPPNIWFLLEIYLLVVFGKQIEQFLGRDSFLATYAVLLLLPPLALTLASFAGIPSIYAGSGALHFSVFIAFATLYPSAEMLFGIAAKWVAVALVAVSGLQSLAARDLVGLTVLAIDAGAAFLLVRWLRAGGGLPDWRALLPARRAPKLTIVREEKSVPVDEILEKISRRGIGSLSARERALLEAARKELLQNEKNKNHA